MYKIIVLNLVLILFFGCSNSTKQKSNSLSSINALNEKKHPETLKTKKIDELLNHFFSKGPLGGVALVSQQGNITYKKAFGKANIELDLEMNTNHKFRIASNTKQFTACAILKLQEQGKLSLSDNLTKYIKDYPTNGHTITIEHLLTHTSGIPDFSSYPGFNEIENTDYKPLEFINIFKNYPLTNNPSEEYQYSNTGYFILGYIIEKVSGQSYGEFLTHTFFNPLGMKNTYYDFPEKNSANKTLGYTQQSAQKFVPSKKISMSIPFAAGSLVSTVDDIAIWYEALKKNKVLHPENLKKAHSPYKLNNGKFTRYGYGWDLGTLSGHKLIAHGGAISGYYSALVYLPTEDVLALVLTNCNWMDASFFDLTTKIASIIINKPYFEASQTSKEILKSYEAVYKTTFNDEIALTIEGNEPYLTINNGRKRPINYISKDLFYSESNFTTLKFIRNKKDSITSLVTNRAVSIMYDRTYMELPKKSVLLAIQSKITKNVDEGILEYKHLKINTPEKYDFENQSNLNNLGYQLLAQNKLEDAIKIFKLLVAEFPKEFNPYDSLGEAYFINEQLLQAKKNYEKSLALNPKNNNATIMINKINQTLK